MYAVHEHQVWNLLIIQDSKAYQKCIKSSCAWLLIPNENLDENHTLFSSDSSLDIEIYTSKQKKLNQRTAFLITDFLLFTSLLAKHRCMQVFKFGGLLDPPGSSTETWTFLLALNLQKKKLWLSSSFCTLLTLKYSPLRSSTGLLQFLGYENGLQWFLQETLPYFTKAWMHALMPK